MKYYKNTELANLLHVSEKAVRNWIDATQQGKLNLELHEEGGRFYIANTTQNLRIVEDIVEDRKKYTNSRGHKVITPSKYFYELFNSSEIADIMLNIDVRNQVPLQYTYFDGGANEWANYVQRMLQNPMPSSPRNTIELLQKARTYIDSIIEGRKYVNIIDLGVGDGSPIREFIGYLLEKGIKVHYIGIDLSQEIITIARRNLEKWFGDSITFEAHKRDINHELFRDLTVEDLYNVGEYRPLNIVLFLGGTLANLRQPDHVLQGINNSMGRDDILISSLKIDSEASRRYFHDNKGGLSPHGLVLDLLNIDESLYDVEQFYDEQKRARFIQARLKVDLSLSFALDNSEKVISLKKGQAIIVWRADHRSVVEIINLLDYNGFDLLNAATIPDKSYLLTISKIKTGQLR